MTVMTILEIPDAGLREVAAAVGSVDDSTRTLIDEMVETMYDARGIGLAATQVGVAQRVVVIDLQEGEDDEGKPIRDPRAFVNPELLWQSKALSKYNEGCLSIPEQYAEVERPSRCRVQWLDRDGEAHEDEMDGLMATCMQHEIDHLNGVLFIDHISRLKRDMIVKKVTKARRAA